MAPQDMLTSRQKPTDVYSLMLILAMVFLLGTIVLVWLELDSSYDFLGSARGATEEAVGEDGEPLEGEFTDEAPVGEDAAPDMSGEPTE